MSQYVLPVTILGNMKTLAQELHGIELLKKKAPSVYKTYKTSRIKRINDELALMREKYPDLSHEEQARLKNHSIYLKAILAELENNSIDNN